MSFAAEALACIRGERRVFAGVDFRVEPGGALILRGPNGAGKSSLLRLAAALLRPAAGLLSWDDIDIQEDPEGHRRRLCFVGHQNAVKGALDAAENLRDWIAIQGGPADGVAAALEAFGLGGLSDTPVQHFSAGQRRRLALARLAASAAPLWLLDEPTVSLDDDGVACLQAVVSRHRAGGGMVLAATHIDLGLDDAAVLRLGPA